MQTLRRGTCAQRRAARLALARADTPRAVAAALLPLLLRRCPFAWLEGRAFASDRPGLPAEAQTAAHARAARSQSASGSKAVSWSPHPAASLRAAAAVAARAMDDLEDDLEDDAASPEAELVRRGVGQRVSCSRTVAPATERGLACCGTPGAPRQAAAAVVLRAELRDCARAGCVARVLRARAG